MTGRPLKPRSGAAARKKLAQRKKSAFLAALDAAVAFSPLAVEKIRRGEEPSYKLLVDIRRSGERGRTIAEICANTGLVLATVRPALVFLKAQGAVEEFVAKDGTTRWRIAKKRK